ncbi:MAG TPA: hypothetical protein VHU23_19765 [Rhizomicrobium sp.]|nr:hypothetical protein [Rhizomicrobium sp.]
MQFRFLPGLLAACALSVLAATTAPAAPRGDLILSGGAIYTLNPAQPWASALVVARGRIAYVGGDAGALAWRGPIARRRNRVP